ncbi:MAG TPA: metallophosphoesterase [Candidatus Acidoferrales bacterium]|nr:metallophosphoesterase [Candidatus Acidoferrales bacterium]
MSPFRFFTTGQGAGKRQSHKPPITGAAAPANLTASSTGLRNTIFPVQATATAAQFKLPHYPFQPLPPANGPAPYRFDLSQLLSADDITRIKNGTLVFQTVGDTGDARGRQQDFVSALMTQDANNLPAEKKPAFFYHLGDVVYFAGDIDKYGANFYETYTDYPGFVVAITGNHDCQPDDPQDGPVDPNKVPFDGWIQNFMSTNPAQLGSLKTNSNRTQMDLPNVFWTFTTPQATIIGLCSNVGETEGEFHQDQIDWFRGELKAADPNLALIVTVHHPPFSGDVEHAGSSVVEQVLFDSFNATKRYPNLILSGHVHNYQRFTNVVQNMQIPCVVAGAGGYTKLGTLHKINGKDPTVPLPLGGGLTLEQYDQTEFGFLRLEVSKNQIVGTYFAALYSPTTVPPANIRDSFTIYVANHTVTTGTGGGKPKPPKPKPPKPTPPKPPKPPKHKPKKKR